VRVKETLPYFDTLETALKELLPYTNSSLSNTGNMQIEPGVYPGVDASLQGTYIQWNMNNNMWEQFISIVLMKENENDSDLYSPPLPHGNIPLSLLDPAWFTCFYNVTDRNTPAAETIKSLLDVYFMKTHWRMMLIGMCMVMVMVMWL